MRTTSSLLNPTVLISASLAVLAIHLSTLTSSAGAGHRDARGGSTPLIAFHHGAHWRSFVKQSSSRSAAVAATRPRSTPSPLPLRATSGKSDDGRSIVERGWENLTRMLGFDRTPSAYNSLSTSPKKKTGRGKVSRTALKSKRPSGGSFPSSRTYTTRKDGAPFISVAPSGVSGDYNHYRTVALGNTPDRALSILTSDVNGYIASLDGGYFAGSYKEGDLGENVLVEGVEFDFFAVGQRYSFGPKRSGDGGDGGGGGSIVENNEDRVVVEITEPMEPCPNLCKLPYINSPKLSPQDRVGRCQYFIEALGQKMGLRGWYAKVVSVGGNGGGVIRIGDEVAPALI